MQQELSAASGRVVTLRHVWADYQITRTLKPVTVRNYRLRLALLADWQDIPVTSITRDMVEQRHRDITTRNGNATANSTMRTLRALLHYAAIKYEHEDGSPLIKNNPVRRLSELRAWHRDKKRKTSLSLRQLRGFFEGCFALSNSTMRDILITLLLTGMRRSEALNLRWTPDPDNILPHVDLELGVIHHPDPKNGEPTTLPVSDYVWRLLRLRSLGKRGPFVFPGQSPDKPFTAAWNSFESVRERCGMKFALHDLRRTFATVGDEIDLKEQLVQQLMNHKPDSQTEDYTCRSVERLRRATQKITDAIFAYAGLTKGM